MRRQDRQTRAVADDAEQRAAFASQLGNTQVNSATARNPALGPAHSIEFDDLPISQKGTGTMQINVSLSGTDVTPSDVLTVALGVDGTALLTETAPVGADASGHWQVSMSFLDQAADLAPHTYKLVVTSNGAHNISAAINSGFISVVEL